MPNDALRSEGLTLLYGLEGREIDVARGLALLKQAADRGDAEAQRELGSALLWGRVAAADPVQARAWLEKAIEGGDASAQRILGEQLVAGWALPRETETGLALLEAGVEAENVGAMTSLSTLYLYGTGVPRNVNRALDLAELAAEAGDGTALWKVGEMWMWSERGATTAEAMLNRAGELGEARAYATLAEGAMYGYLGGGKVSRAKYKGYAEKAREAGNTRVAVLDANRQMWGINMRASGPATLAGLRAAAENGNGDAAQFLIRLLRDGNRLNVRRNVSGAEEALEEFAPLLDEIEYWQLERTIQARRAYTPSGYKKLAEAVNAYPARMSSAFAQDLYKANPNAMIYLLQMKLSEEGFFAANPNGYADKRTIRALNKACPSLPDNPACDDSVMRPDILGALLARS
ncbi:sel1 repeat family protein [Celeribacter sp. ASW11-22]|nr:sel1 repeat family protein [Celeribacter litoreus]